MRQAPIGILALGIILSLCGIASAATHTISWSPVVTYTDGAAINGKTVSYSLYWSTTPRLTSITMFDYGLTRTSRTFDPAALGMAVGRTVYFTMRTKLSTGVGRARDVPQHERKRLQWIPCRHDREHGRLHVHRAAKQRHDLQQ
jgi:hypothetical protein